MTHAGIDLKVERVRARVRVTELSLKMGLSRQAIHATERAAIVSADRAAAYLAAVAEVAASKETAGVA